MPGEPLRVGWTTTPTGPYRDAVVFLFVWFDEARPTDLTPFGYPGCALWAPLDPKRYFTLIPNKGGLLTNEAGRVDLRWTPGPEFRGRKVYTQLAVYSPGSNVQGWLLSPGLEIWVGSR